MGIEVRPEPTESTWSVISLLNISVRLSLPPTSTLPLWRAVSTSVTVVTRKMSASGAKSVTAMSCILPIITPTRLPERALKTGGMSELTVECWELAVENWEQRVGT